MCKIIGVKLDNKHWYQHVPKSVETSCGGKVMLLWNQQWQTKRTSPNSQTDITIHDNVAISRDRNVIKKETEKSLKYKDLTKYSTCGMQKQK
jgi:predicted nucleic acid-binding OB-fold protein